MAIALSPDKRRVAFDLQGCAVGRADRGRGGHAVDRRVRRHPPAGLVPDGRRLAFQSYRDGTWRDLDGRRRRPRAQAVTPGRSMTASRTGRRTDAASRSRPIAAATTTSGSSTSPAVRVTQVTTHAGQRLLPDAGRRTGARSRSCPPAHPRPACTRSRLMAPNGWWQRRGAASARRRGAPTAACSSARCRLRKGAGALAVPPRARRRPPHNCDSGRDVVAARRGLLSVPGAVDRSATSSSTRPTDKSSAVSVSGGAKAPVPFSVSLTVRPARYARKAP